MKAQLDCIPCFLSQALEASRFVSKDEDIHSKVLKKVMKFILNTPLNKAPPEISMEIHKIIRNTIKSGDPYRAVKRRSNEMAKGLYPILKRMVEESKDPLLTSVKFAIAGNSIDFGTMKRFDVRDVIKEALVRDIDHKVYQEFIEDITKSDTILYLSDNAGEVFFDKILVEELKNMGKSITYVVKSNPIINDATIEDARFAGIDKLVEVIEGDRKGCSAPGFILSNANKDFMERFRRYDIVISKGQGNYESLSDADRKIYFLLLVKCPLVARDLNSNVGEYIIRVNI